MGNRSEAVAVTGFMRKLFSGFSREELENYALTRFIEQQILCNAFDLPDMSIPAEEVGLTHQEVELQKQITAKIFSQVDQAHAKWLAENENENAD